jgi:hypothetical protein
MELMTKGLHAGDLIKVRGYQQSPSDGLIPVYSICEVVAVELNDFPKGTLCERVRVVHHYPNNPAGWELPSFTVLSDDISPPF